MTYLSLWQSKRITTEHVLSLQLPSEALRCITSSLAQNVLCTSISLRASEPLMCVRSLRSHVCGVPIHLYVIKFNHFLWLICPLIRLLDQPKEPQE